MKKSQIFSIIAIATSALGIIFALFLAGITVKAFGIETSEKGMEIMFGQDGFDFSFMLFLGFLLAIAGIVFAVLSLVGKGSKIFTILGIVFFAVAAIFTFMTKQFAMVDGKMFNDWGSYTHLGVGAILGGIFYICAAVATALPLCIKD